ncbi:MAG: hypothetical protein P0116_05875 [Candidatus Nitrosocosmicus sp.]|nr:hypothetical protein [Candidatus Nitrosocosmicus sp.]
MCANWRTERVQREPFCKEDSGITCHAICRIKKYRIMNEVLRNKVRKYDGVSDMISTCKL